MIEIPVWNVGLPIEPRWRVLVDGRPVPVIACARGAVAQWIADGACTVEIHGDRPLDGLALRPRSSRLIPEVLAQRAAWHMAGPGRVLIEVDGLPMLHCFAEPPPSPAPTGAIVVAAGEFRRADRIDLGDGDRLWVSPGGVLAGRVVAGGAGIALGGGGIIDGRWSGPGHAILADGCPDISLADLTLLDHDGWNVVVAASDGARLEALRILTPGSGSGTDGIDLVGSSRVSVRRCYVVAGDDAIVIKAFPRETVGRVDWARPVSGIAVRDCILGTTGGHCLEIGHELTVDAVTDVSYDSIDVMFAHTFGGPFGIHAGDRATVSRVAYRQVRVEHCYHHLLDVRVMRSRYSRDAERGAIADLLFEDIDWWTTPFNAGYTIATMAGHDAAHRVTGVVFRRFRKDGVAAASADDLDLLTRHVDGLVFTTG